MNGSEASKPTAVRQRLLLGGVLALGLAALGLGTAGAGTLDRPQAVRAQAASAAVAITFPAAPTTTTTSSTTTVPPAPASPVVAAQAPAPEPAPAPQPVAAPTPAPAPAGSVEDAIATSFGDVYDQAIAVARCESGLDPNAVSRGGGNWGLFQINVVHKSRVEAMGYSWDQILDPYVNAAVARSIYDDAGGWGPWGCRRAAY